MKATLEQDGQIITQAAQNGYDLIVNNGCEETMVEN